MDVLDIFGEIAVRWIPKDLIDGKSGNRPLHKLLLVPTNAAIWLH